MPAEPFLLYRGSAIVSRQFPQTSVHCCSIFSATSLSESVLGLRKMGRGVSYGGGQSSLGYLFGPDEPSKVASSGVTTAVADNATPLAVKESTPPSNQVPPTLAKTTPENEVIRDIAAGQLGSNPNTYHRADGQNTGNFITDRPSTKVHSAPGGGSSLGYLFGGGN